MMGFPKYGYSLEFLLFCLFLIFISCKKSDNTMDTTQPVSCFSPSAIITPSTQGVTFQNCCENNDRVIWDLGDGVTTNETSPIHSFPYNGVFTITLTAYRGSKTDVSAKRIIIAKSVLENINFNFSNIWFCGNNYIWYSLSICLTGYH